MADVKVRLEVNPDSEIEKLGDLYVDNVNKVSNSSYKADSNGKYQNIQNEESAGIEGLSFAKGYLVFNSDGYLANPDSKIGMLVSEQEPQEFVWGATDSNGYYDVTISFKNATSLDSVVFYGDKVSNQFPTIAYLDGSSYPISSDDSRLAIKFNKPSTEHSIRFTNWNRPNYNAVLTKITVMPRYWEIDKNTGLKSIESLSQSTGQPKSIFYGVIPSDGTLDILDIDGEIEEMVNSEVIPVSNLPVEIFINGTKVQSHISVDSDYNSQSKLLNIVLTNELNDLDSIKIVNQKYPGYSRMNNESIITIALKKTLSLLGLDDNYISEMLKEKIFYGNGESLRYGTILEYLNLITLPAGFAYTSATSVYESLNEICSIAQLNVVKDDNGLIKFTQARPIASKSDTVIKIPKKFQLSAPQIDILLKNKYSNVRINKDVLKKELNSVINSSYTIKDSDGNVKIDEINETAKFVTDANGSNFICFFITANSSANMMRADINTAYWKYSVTYSNEHISNHAGSIKESPLSMEEFVFEQDEMVGSCVRLTKDSTVNSETFAVTIPFDSYYGIPQSVGLDIRGYEFNVVKETTLVNDKKDIYEFYHPEGLLNSELFCSDYGYGKVYMYDMITNNILSDYKNGIKTISTSVICGDYYDTNGEIAKNWSNGDILKVGDIVQLDKDNVGTSMLTYPNGEPMNFKVTTRRFKKEGVPVVDLELQEVKLIDYTTTSKSFAEDSWNTIDLIASSGRASEFYSIGNEKEIEVGLYTYTAVILGFNHDELADGSGKAGITIGLKNLAFGQIYMNKGASNKGGWNDSYMRNTILGDMFYDLEPELQYAIKKVNKYSSYGKYNNNTVIASQDRLWLPSLVEITGIDGSYYSIQGEGSQYEYWKNFKNGSIESDRIKYGYGEPTQAYDYWLRSSVPTSESAFTVIMSYGKESSKNASQNAGVSFCFCV